MTEGFMQSAKVTDYLKAIGITKPLLERIAEIFEFYRGFCPEKITGIFVSEYMKEDGTREYENLWFFSERYSMEAKQFVTKDDFDLMPMKGIGYLRIEKEEYDFGKATEKSRLNLQFNFTPSTLGGLSGTIKASKENCDYLKNIFEKYVKPNLVG